MSQIRLLSLFIFISPHGGTFKKQKWSDFSFVSQISAIFDLDNFHRGLTSVWSRFFDESITLEGLHASPYHEGHTDRGKGRETVRA